jgi:hypothetical protein
LIMAVFSIANSVKISAHFADKVHRIAYRGDEVVKVMFRHGIEPPGRYGDASVRQFCR